VPGVTVALPRGGRGEREELELALSPQAMAARLATALGTGGGRACRVLDAKYEPSRRASVLYELGGRLVLGVLRWDEDGDGAPAGDRDGRGLPGRMLAYQFPHDPALPGLPTALDGGALAPLLEAALPECATGAARLRRCRVRALRYRPGRRCTLRLELVLGAGGGGRRTLVRYAKLYHDPRKARAVDEEARLLSEAPGLRAAGAHLPRPSAFLPELVLVIQEPLGGVPLGALLGRADRTAGVLDGRVAGGIDAAARALAALHVAGLESVRRRPIAAALERMARRGAAVRRVEPALGGRMEELAEALAEDLPALERGARIVLVHGDLKPSQVLVRDDGVGLLDLDHCGMADAACDVGDFMAGLRRLALDRPAGAARAGGGEHARSLRALEERFLGEYRRRAPADVALARRARWYESVALVRKSFRAFQRSPRSPLSGALLEQARVSLERSREEDP